MLLPLFIRPIHTRNALPPRPLRRRFPLGQLGPLRLPRLPRFPNEPGMGDELFRLDAVLDTLDDARHDRLVVAFVLVVPEAHELPRRAGPVPDDFDDAVVELLAGRFPSAEQRYVEAVRPRVFLGWAGRQHPGRETEALTLPTCRPAPP